MKTGALIFTRLAPLALALSLSVPASADCPGGAPAIIPPGTPIVVGEAPAACYEETIFLVPRPMLDNAVAAADRADRLEAMLMESEEKRVAAENRLRRTEDVSWAKRAAVGALVAVAFAVGVVVGDP